MGLDPKLLEKILKQLEKMIPLREEIVEWLKAFIDDVKTQEIAVNSVKTTGAAVGVLSTIALFTPLAPLGVAGLVGAGAAGVATTIGDLIANKVKGDNLFERAKSMAEDDLKLGELMKKVEQGAQQLQKELNVSREDAILFLLVGVPKAAAQAGLQVVKGSVEIAKILPHLKAARDAMQFGASFAQAFKLSSTVFQGAGRATVMGAGQAARVGTTLAITTTTKVLGAFGAVIGVGDAIYSWATKNPTRKSAEALLGDLEERVAKLKKLKEELSNLK